MTTCCKIILWVGPKHSGKTTAAEKLVEKARAEGFNVAGILAPSIYHNGKIAGFEIIDLQNQKRMLLTRRKKDNEPFSFTTEGLKFGRAALGKNKTKQADLIIVDEFGPLELTGKGWRKCVDSLIKSVNALILLVVREESAEEVSRLYSHKHQMILPVSDFLSADNEQFWKIIDEL